MNVVTLTGRLAKDPDVRYSQSGTAVARFSIAIDRGKDKEGNDRGADFPSIVVFGKSAEFCEKYIKKGDMVSVKGKLQTGSYEKQDGTKVYTTEIVADNYGGIEILKKKGDKQTSEKKDDDMPDGLSLIEDDEIPF